MFLPFLCVYIIVRQEYNDKKEKRKVLIQQIKDR